MSSRRHDGRSRDPLDDLTPTEAMRVAIGRRLREVRETLFGAYDLTMLSETIGVTEEQWHAYEMGSPMPTELCLAFMDATGVTAHWLLTGRGDRYRVGRWILQPHNRN